MRSLKHKLLIFILPLCLLPLISISVFSYFVAKERITEDRIVLYLQQIATEVAHTLQLTMLEKKEETVSMTLYGEFRDYLLGRSKEPPVALLDKLVMVHQVYDVIVLFDVDGRIVAMNAIDRNTTEDVIEYLNEKELEGLRGSKSAALHTDLRLVAGGPKQPVRLYRLAQVCAGPPALSLPR